MSLKKRRPAGLRSTARSSTTIGDEGIFEQILRDEVST